MLVARYPTLGRVLPPASLTSPQKTDERPKGGRGAKRERESPEPVKPLRRGRRRSGCSTPAVRAARGPPPLRSLGARRKTDQVSRPTPARAQAGRRAGFAARLAHARAGLRTGQVLASAEHGGPPPPWPRLVRALHLNLSPPPASMPHPPAVRGKVGGQRRLALHLPNYGFGRPGREGASSGLLPFQAPRDPTGCQGGFGDGTCSPLFEQRPNQTANAARDAGRRVLPSVNLKREPIGASEISETFETSRRGSKSDRRLPHALEIGAARAYVGFS